MDAAKVLESLGRIDRPERGLIRGFRQRAAVDGCDVRTEGTIIGRDGKPSAMTVQTFETGLYQIDDLGGRAPKDRVFLVGAPSADVKTRAHFQRLNAVARRAYRALQERDDPRPLRTFLQATDDGEYGERIRKNRAVDRYFRNGREEVTMAPMQEFSIKAAEGDHPAMSAAVLRLAQACRPG